MGLDCFHAEPTPFTTSNHPFLAGNSNGLVPPPPSAFASTVGGSGQPAAACSDGSLKQSEHVWQSETVVNPEWTADQLASRYH